MDRKEKLGILSVGFLLGAFYKKIYYGASLIFFFSLGVLTGLLLYMHLLEGKI